MQKNTARDSATASPAPAASMAVVPDAAPAGEHWPANVPSLEAAAEILSGAVEPAPGMEEATRTFIKSLNSTERTAAWGGALPFNASGLQTGLLTRCRVSLALALEPPPGTAVDGTAADVLFTQIDGVLARLTADAQIEPSELRAAIAATREVLARDAVAFSEALHRVAGQSLEGPATAWTKYDHAAPPPPKTATKVTFEAAASSGKKVDTKLIILGVVVVLAVGFQIHRILTAPELRPLHPPGAPTQLIGAQDNMAPVTMVHLSHGETMDPTELARFRQQVESGGATLQEVGPGQFAIIRAPKPAVTGKEAGKNP